LPSFAQFVPSCWYSMDSCRNLILSWCKVARRQESLPWKSQPSISFPSCARISFLTVIVHEKWLFWVWRRWWLREKKFISHVQWVHRGTKHTKAPGIL
jgi:hypothetical protein